MGEWLPHRDAQNREVERTVRTERSRLLRFIRSRVPSDADAEDILQEVFGELVGAYRRFETIERVTAWLFRVARNKLIDAYRARRHESPMPASRHDDGLDQLLDELVVDRADGPERVLFRQAFWDEVEAALDELPGPQRQAWLWHEIEELSFKEMSERSGDTENALRLRKHRAARWLRGRLRTARSEV